MNLTEAVLTLICIGVSIIMMLFIGSIYPAAGVIALCGLLDETTSNLDSLNGGIILKALKDTCKDKTVVLVSHRKSTMNAANVVYEMDNGRIS